MTMRPSHLTTTPSGSGAQTAQRAEPAGAIVLANLPAEAGIRFGQDLPMRPGSV